MDKSYLFLFDSSIMPDTDRTISCYNCMFGSGIHDVMAGFIPIIAHLKWLKLAIHSPFCHDVGIFIEAVLINLCVWNR